MGLFGDGSKIIGKQKERRKFIKGFNYGGPEFCVCPNCGIRKKHERDCPCKSMSCPKCGSKMVPN